LPTQFGKHFWPNSSFVYGLRLDYLSPIIYLTDILILVIFIFYFPKLIKVIAKIQKKYLIGFALFLLFLSLGLIGAKNYQAGLYGMIKVLEFSFLGVFIIENFKTLNKTILFILLWITITFGSALALLQYFNQGSIGGLFYYFGERTFNAQTPGIANASINGQLFLRPYATFSHPNVFAGFLIIAMLFLFAFVGKAKVFSLFLWPVIILGTSVLLLTLSRTAILLWVTYLIILFGIWMYEKYKKGNYNPTVFVPAVVGLLAIFIILFQNGFILQRFISTDLNDESIIQRQALMSSSITMFANHPIVGVGVNNFFDNLSPIAGNQRNILIQPVHNIFLLIMSEAGAVGLMFAVYLFSVSLLRSSRQKQKGTLLLAVFAVIFLGMFDHYFLTLQQGQLLLSFVLGIALAKS